MIIISRHCLVPDCGGADHKWELERPTLREFRFIQETVGLDPDRFEAAMNEGGTIQSIDAVLALLAILHRRDRIIVPFEDIDADLAHLEFLADPEPEPPEEKPTGPPPTSPHQKDPEPAPSSGGSTAEASEPKSSPTEPTSGGSSD